MRQGRTVLSLLLILLFVVLSLHVPFARAQQTDISQGIQVSPVVIDLNGEKGKDYTLNVTVTNITAGTMDISTEVNDFVAEGESGNPKVITDENVTTGYSLKNWVSLPPSFSLNTKESKTVAVSVDIPADAEPGGHYGVVRFSGTPPGQSASQVSLNASVGVLLLTRVDGNITESLSIEQMSIQKNGKNKGLVATGPVTVATRIKNDGNVHLKPIGTLTIKNMFGKVVGSYPFGSQTKNVLPQTTRLYTQEFDKRWMFGRYSVDLQAAYGTQGGVLLGTTTFWVIPFQLIFFILALGVLGFFLLRFILRRYNQRVIRKHQQPPRKK